MKTIQEAIKEIEALDTIDRDDDAVEAILEDVDERTYVWSEAGSFDSPGHDMVANAIAYLDGDAPALFTYIQESY